MTGNGPEPPARPQIVVEFTGDGELGCDIKATPGINVAQLAAAAWLLDTAARERRATAFMAEASGGLVLPTAPDLLRTGRPDG